MASVITAVIVGLMLGIGFASAGWTVFWLFRYIAVGATDHRTRLDALGPRVGGFIHYVLGQARVIREFGGFLHFFIFWGFLVLQAETMEYFVRGFVPGFRFGQIIGMPAYNGILLVQDIFGLLVFVAIVAAAVRRYIVRPPHVMPSLDAGIILLLIGGLMVSKFFAHGAEIASATDQAALGWNPAWTPVAAFTAKILGGAYAKPGSGALHVLYTVMYFLHIGIVVVFANWIPRGKHLHLLGAMPNIFFRRLEPRGALYPLDLEDEDAESFGAGKLEDLSWKQLLDTYACTECGRCEHYCPAFNTGKELNPMMIVHKIKDHIKDKGEKVYKFGIMELAGKLGNVIKTRKFDPADFRRDDVEVQELVGDLITPEELMACTTCGACVANCPVLIEHVDTIVDMRRYLVLTQGEVSAEIGRTFKNIENNSNPWGVSNSRRGDWADGLDIPLASELESPPDYLFFVGCAGSFDERAKKITLAMVKLLRAADVSFAILGPEESCTGDAPRRIGNEYLYWTLASQNIETMNSYGVTRIITTCPHCFHTIGKEYKQLGGNFDVIHHTELLNNLVAEGRLRLENRGERSFVYHDSCYIGRWNNDYDNPREALTSIPGVSINEMPMNRRQALCCGAGGGQMWMEEDQGKRVNLHRADMAIETGGDALVSNCPFCMTMLSDGLAQRESSLQTLDLAEVMADALPRDEVYEAEATDAAE